MAFACRGSDFNFSTNALSLRPLFLLPAPAARTHEHRTRVDTSGFDNSVGAQSEETLTQLRFAFIGIPIAGTLTAIFVMRNYDLDEKKATEIRDELNLRAEAAS